MLNFWICSQWHHAFKQQDVNICHDNYPIHFLASMILMPLLETANLQMLKAKQRKWQSSLEALL
jgi:hypothetical protein